MISEANQAHIDDHTNEKEDHVIQNVVRHSHTVEKMTLESHDGVPLGYVGDAM